MILITVLAGCGSPRPFPTVHEEAFPGQPCSQLARLAHRAQGDEGEACGPVPVEQRELLAVGNGHVLEWVPTTGRYQIWSVGTDHALGERPLVTGISGIRQGHVLYPIGDDTLLDPNLTDSGWRTYRVDVNATGFASGIVSLGNGSWPDPFWGHELVALDDDFLLKWWSGSGEYVVLKRDLTRGTLVATAFHGRHEGLRRGARLVNLGGHRLLEWIPVTGSYRIWTYRFDPAGGEIFAAEPTFPAAAWGDVNRRQEILVVDRSPGAERIMVWNRDDGRIVLRTLDPLAADPLAGELIADEPHPLLSSPEWAPDPTSCIENVVLIFQRGRSFDSYFGQYCQGGPGVACNQGPDCCEAMPSSTPGASMCAPLDVSVDDHTPDDSRSCLAAKIANGAMDGYVTAPNCGDPRDFACAGTGNQAGAVSVYHQLADTGALGDRFFQSTIDGDAVNADANLLYLSKAAYGASVSSEGGYDQLTFLMSQAGVLYALYLDDPKSVPERFGQTPPQFFDAHWTAFRDVTELERDIALEQLPAISLVIPPPGLNEQPGKGPAKAGIDFVAGVVDQIARSPRYQPKTLVVLAYLSSGGYFDHVTPPAAPPLTVDATGDGSEVPYGPRLPFLALGSFARPGYVSHVQMEMSSLTAFLEWNWRANLVARVGHRDATANNIGSLLDPQKAGDACFKVAPPP